MYYWKIKNNKKGVERYIATIENKAIVNNNEVAIRVPQMTYEMFNSVDIEMFKEHCYINEYKTIPTSEEILNGDYDGDCRPLLDLDSNPF